MRDGKEVVQCVFYENVSLGKILLFRMWLCFIKEQWQISHINLPWHSSASMCCCYPRMMNISIIFSIHSLNLEAFTSNQTTKIWRNYWIPFDTGYKVAPLPFHESEHLRKYHYIWQKHLFGLNDKLVRSCWSLWPTKHISAINEDWQNVAKYWQNIKWL